MSEIALTSVPEFTASADPQPVRFTISVEGGYPASRMSAELSALLAQMRHSLPAAYRITLHESRSGLADMTARQQQILQLMVHDLSNKDIGRRLGLSHFTVRNHVSQLLRLLGVSSRKAATALIRKMAEGGDQGGAGHGGHDAGWEMRLGQDCPSGGQLSYWPGVPVRHSGCGDTIGRL
ncbi:response regulator transcription factor [Fuscibacter oryzae]|uniref:Response regulator transcription factor n=1 Tax=Fuscibacter oryzae TaxID=2803939 RepID=A0A8J7SW30_9RHOB|nr:LuxR C-terminal-related transcriptional regulator [Fuscibacter oryzae]MBL4928479.1 response regulator transcription factor [Fuscibacter oryzae]